MGDPFTDPFETRAPRWDSAGERARWLTRVAAHVDRITQEATALTKLLHFARGPLPPVRVVNLVCCNRCGHGPFEGLECPECGDDDLRPAGESVENYPPRSPEVRAVAPVARAAPPPERSGALPAGLASLLALPEGKPPRKRRRAGKGKANG